MNVAAEMSTMTTMVENDGEEQNSAHSDVVDVEGADGIGDCLNPT